MRVRGLPSLDDGSVRCPAPSVRSWPQDMDDNVYQAFTTLPHATSGREEKLHAT